MVDRALVSLPFDYLAKARLKNRDRSETYVVRDQFDVMVPLRRGKDREGLLRVSPRHREASTDMPIWAGTAYRPSAVPATGDHRTVYDTGGIELSAMKDVLDLCIENLDRLTWSTESASPVRLSSRTVNRTPCEALTRAFYVRRLVDEESSDRDARLASAIEDAGHLLFVDERLHTSLREPVVTGYGHASFVDFGDPWNAKGPSEEMHSLETVLAADGLQGLENAGFTGDVHMVRRKLDDLLLSFNILSRHLFSHSEIIVRRTGDVTFGLFQTAQRTMRSRTSAGSVGASDLWKLIECAASADAEGTTWKYTTGRDLENLLARLSRYYPRPDVGQEADEESLLNLLL